MIRRLLIVICLCVPCFGQAWSGILSNSRAIDWSHAGLPPTFPDGETTTTPWLPPSRAQCGPTLTPSGADDTPQILNAFNGVGAFSTCTPPYAVLLGASTSAAPFQINSFLRLGGSNTRNNVTLRGSGPMSTFVSIAGGIAIQAGACCQVGGSGAGALTSAASNYTTGQSTLLLQNVTSAPFVGAIAFILQCDNGFTPSSSGQPLTTATVTGGATCTGAASNNDQRTASLATVYHCSDVICAQFNADSLREQDRQLVRVTSVTNTSGSNWTVTISPGLYLGDWSFSQGATLSWDNDIVSIGIGIEAMTIRPADHTASVVIGNGGYAHWMKGVRMIAFNDVHMFSITECKNCLASNNYFVGNNPSSLQTGFTNTSFQNQSSDSLYLNNIITNATFLDDGEEQQGEVVAYNYSRDSSGGGDGYQSTLFEHQPGSQLQLRESNQWGRTNDDDTAGTHNFETDFRNNLNCADTPNDLKGPGSGGFQYGSFARFENSIGNVIGFGQALSIYSSKCPVYQGAATDGFVWNLNGSVTRDTSGLTEASLMRWGNVDSVNGAAQFNSAEVPTSTVMPSSTFPLAVAYQNPVPATHNLPASFFIPVTAHPVGGTGLSWWKPCDTWSSSTLTTATCTHSTTIPFPPNGPDVSGFINDIPAAIAWKTLPIDTSFQSSFAVTGSSWASGIETLTVTLPVSYPIGGFQLTGANAACIPTSGASFTGRSDNEILITSPFGGACGAYPCSGNSTAFTYALPVNPGVQCTGTVKWPDVRQFDEKVYQFDPPGACTNGNTCCTGSTSCTVVDACGPHILTALQSINLDNTTVNVPANSCTWTAGISYTQTNSFSLSGAGAQSAGAYGSSTPTGTDQTIFSDAVSHTGNANPMLNISTIAGKSVRVTGIAFLSDPTQTTTTANGVITIGGFSTAVRVDHNHFNFEVGGTGSVVLRYFNVNGVTDHNWLDFNLNSLQVWAPAFVPATNDCPTGGCTNGHGSWHDFSYWGSSKFMFFEDNSFNNQRPSLPTYANDCTNGGRQVFRHNTMLGGAALEEHDGAGGQEGCRATEVYQNTGTTTAAGANYFVFVRSGGTLIWGNTINGYGIVSFMNNDRSSTQLSHQGPVSTGGGWGECGGLAPGATASETGTVTVSGANILWASGTQFDNVNWITGTVFYLNDAGTGRWYNIAAVASPTSLTIQQGAPDPQCATTCTYFVGSPLDQNADFSGYRCINQPGAGRGADLLTGGFPPTNVRTSTTFWPNEALDPLYVWNQNFTPRTFSNGYAGIGGGGTTTTILKENRDYYSEQPNFSESTNTWNGLQPAALGGQSPFGPGGVGQGLASARPTNCDPFVGYWETDNKKLDRCTATNTWTTQNCATGVDANGACFYIPFTYPHPLLNAQPAPSFTMFTRNEEQDEDPSAVLTRGILVDSLGSDSPSTGTGANRK